MCCGSGASTRGLANHFDHAIGIDPGRELILQTRSIGGQTKTGNPIKYEICSAKEACLARTAENGSINLLSVGMAVRLQSFLNPVD
jgi:trans-aconitate 3-methyltransferase